MDDATTAAPKTPRSPQDKNLVGFATQKTDKGVVRFGVCSRQFSRHFLRESASGMGLGGIGHNRGRVGTGIAVAA
jgi:hypothetical protein